MESKDPVLWEDDWLQVRSYDDYYTYIHVKKADGEGVGVLAYSKDPLMVLGRFEHTPPHGDGIALSSLTGMMDDPDETPLETAVRELEEESGLTADKEKFLSLGQVRPSKDSDYIIHMFAVLVDFESGELLGKGDGTKGEENAYCKFVSLQEAIGSKCPVLISMVARLLTKRIL